MHVICPNCGARYAVHPTAIGPTGRTVQCVGCNHRWFEKIQAPATRAADPTPQAAPQAATVPNFVIRPSVPGAGLPAIAHPRRKKSWGMWLSAAVGLVVLLAAAAFTYREEIRDRLPPEWRPLFGLGTVRTLFAPSAKVERGGRQDRAQLEVDVPASKVELVDGRYVVQGKLVNNGRSAGSTSLLKVVFRSDERVLGEHTYALVEGPIEPGTRVNFSQTLDDPPAGTTNIVPTVE